MILERSAKHSHELQKATIKERESIRNGIILGAFELTSIVKALGGRVPEEGAL